MLTALLSLVVASSPAVDLDRAVTTVIGELHLSNIDGFDLGEDIALYVDMSRTVDGQAVGALVVGIVRARLEQLGADRLRIVEATADPDGVARRAGAEWLVSVVGDRTAADRLRLFATLRRVDRGLWAPPPDADATSIYAIAEQTLRLAATPAPPPPIAPPPPEHAQTPSLVEPAVAIGTIGGKVVAAGACSLVGTDTDQLIVLTENTVAVYTFDRRRLNLLAQLDLGDRPRARLPSRERIGAVTCAADAAGHPVVGVGTSSLEHGYVLKVDEPKRGRFQLRVVAELPSVPLAYRDGTWLLGWTDSGRSQWDKSLGRYTSGAAVRFDAAPTFALAAAEAVWFAVDPSYQLLRAKEGLDQPEVIGKAGSAIAVLPGASVAFYTAPVLTDGRDVVSMYSTEYPSSAVPVGGPVQALAAGRFRSGKTDVIATTVRGAQTELFVIGVSGMKVEP